MQLLRELWSVSPLLWVLAAALAWALALTVRYRAALLLLTAWVLVCGSLLAMPAGRAALERARALPTTPEKARCLGDSLASGAVWASRAQAARVVSCRYVRAVPARPRSEAYQLQLGRPASKALLRLYGGRPYRP